jgi:osmotically inducible protein OsmC
LQATITQIEKELTMTEVHKVLYTAKTHTTGGRDGASRSSDGRLDIKLSSPGTAGTGTNPEQLFAAGWSACFEGAMELAVRKMKTALPADLAIDAEVDLILADGAYFLGARLNVSLPGLEREAAQALVDEAHRTCPYSKLTRGNIASRSTWCWTGTPICPPVFIRPPSATGWRPIDRCRLVQLLRTDTSSPQATETNSWSSRRGGHLSPRGRSWRSVDALPASERRYALFRVFEPQGESAIMPKRLTPN